MTSQPLMPDDVAALLGRSPMMQDAETAAQIERVTKIAATGEGDLSEVAGVAVTALLIAAALAQALTEDHAAAGASLGDLLAEMEGRK